jgi:2,4-dienoyl-CoA reductase-like NADH-dependent reductase (Old Yellow Enzyme family)
LTDRPYPLLFSDFQIRNTRIRNRVVFPPTCPSWVSDPRTAEFNDLAPAYYEERASGGVGLIIIGGTHVTESSVAAPLAQPGLWNDRQIEGFARVAEACHRHDCKVAVQLRHTGLRGFTQYKLDPAYDPDATWYTFGPSQVPLGEYPAGAIPKELTDAEIEEILDAHASAASRAIRAGLDGVEFHLSHGFMSWQFLSPLYNKRTDRWGGSYENRLRFPLEALRRMRAAIGDGPFLGYRINSTSFWPGDLELEDVTRIVADLDEAADVDFVDLSVGVHHQFIHAPMDFEPGWEEPYSRAIKAVTSKPVFLVGRITTPDVAERLLEGGAADAICLARQLFADPDWALKAMEDRGEDIRRCVAANLCWKTVNRGGRVQCVYNPTVGRERTWGRGSLRRVQVPKRVLVIGAGPAGLEFARVAAARGHDVLVMEREERPGGHAFLQSLLPSRAEYGRIGSWLADQARRRGAELRLRAPVTLENLDALLESERPDHVVVSTGSRVCRDGFQGWTGSPIPGHETGCCVGWDEVVTERVRPTGHVMVLDDQCDVIGPLTAVAIADGGLASSVRIVTRWPMIGMDTMLDAYFEWIMPRVYGAGVEILTDRFVRRIEGNRATLYNLYQQNAEVEVDADFVVMATARQSENQLLGALLERGMSAEAIGDAVAPRGTYEAVYEGHRQGRKV